MSGTGPSRCPLCMTIDFFLADLDQHSKLGLVASLSVVSAHRYQ
jgi:hypothetical protein